MFRHRNAIRRSVRSKRLTLGFEVMESRRLLSGSPPDVFNDWYETLHDQQASGWASGADPDGDELSYSLVDNASNGLVNLDSDGSFYYTPDYHFVGVDSFTFKANDGTNDSNIGTIEISVNNSGPEVFDEWYETLHDQDVGGTVSGWDADGDPVSFSLLDNASHGSVDFYVDGSFTYTPNYHYVGSDSFTYSASDGIEEVTNTVYLDVTNQSPEVWDDSYEILHDQAFGGWVSGSDGDSDPLTYSLVVNAAHGTVDFNSDGSFTYTPNYHYVGPDGFTFKANDGIADSNVGRIDISITNESPNINVENLETFVNYPLPSSTIVAAFSDSDDDDPAVFSAQIDWGDGNVTGGTIVRNQQDQSIFNIIGGHTYSASGHYPLKVTVYNLDATATGQGMADVIKLRVWIVGEGRHSDDPSVSWDDWSGDLPGYTQGESWGAGGTSVILVNAETGEPQTDFALEKADWTLPEGALKAMGYLQQNMRGPTIPMISASTWFSPATLENRPK